MTSLRIAITGTLFQLTLPQTRHDQASETSTNLIIP
jgi:hypothetical protein